MKKTQSLRRCRFPRGAAITRGQRLGKPLLLAATDTYLDERADDDPDHVVKKAIPFHVNKHA